MYVLKYFLFINQILYLLFSIVNSTGTTCKACPTGAVCKGGDRINVLEGYWRPDNLSDTITRCKNNPGNC